LNGRAFSRGHERLNRLAVQRLLDRSQEPPAVAGRTAIWVLDGMATSIVALLSVSAIFGVRIDLLRAAAVLPLVVLTCLSTFCLALFVGAVAALRPSLRTMIGILVRMTILAICGVNVPVAFWPAPVQVLATAAGDARRRGHPAPALGRSGRTGPDERRAASAGGRRVARPGHPDVRPAGGAGSSERFDRVRLSS